MRRMVEKLLPRGEIQPKVDKYKKALFTILQRLEKEKKIRNKKILYLEPKVLIHVQWSKNS